MSRAETATAGAAAERIDMVIVGAGFGGMYATYKFREMGLNIVSIEEGGDVGGVWYWNRYPGARCDLLSVDYSYGFSDEIQQEWTWSEQFAAQPEILAYANFVADRLDLRKHYRFGTRVDSAKWDEARQLWVVRTNDGKVLEATYCVMSTGPLSKPTDPDIPGLDRFKGLTLRAARWPHEEPDLKGKRIGVLGTGSSGMQIIQTLGRTDCELFVFQRTPSFTLPMRNRKVTEQDVAELKANYASIRAACKLNPTGGARPVSTRPFFSIPADHRQELMEQAWQHGGHTFLGIFSDLMVNQSANDQVADFVRDRIHDTVDDKAIAEKLKPRGYPIFARRPCLDTGYYETYNRPNVHLVDCLEDPIVEITETGIRTRSGDHQLDVLILATGYDALTGALLAFEITGRDGAALKDKWRDGPRSLFGVLMQGFPNMFMTTGPNGPAALANIFTISENDVDFIAGVIAHMQKTGQGAVEASAQAEDAWMAQIEQLASRSLMLKAKTWWTGSNVKGKPQGMAMFTGGFHKYREACEAVAANGYRDLSFQPAKQLEPAAG
ncbi:flavin-containing monooxygenase [Pararhodobacter marinus]|uniref:flavin-containing monooxygenase n=1 Tax=Pararhodobacter marinus TaxID=2184063 RepID=UPI003513BE38